MEYDYANYIILNMQFNFNRHIIYICFKIEELMMVSRIQS